MKLTVEREIQPKKHILSKRGFEFKKFQYRTKNVTKEEFDVNEDPKKRLS